MVNPVEVVYPAVTQQNRGRMWAQRIPLQSNIGKNGELVVLFSDGSVYYYMPKEGGGYEERPIPLAIPHGRGFKWRNEEDQPAS